MNMVLKSLFAMGFMIAQASANETYPSRTVTLVVPFPAGSFTDGVARKLGESLRQRLGQQFVIENKAGADGIIAARAVAGADPDGYTLLVTTNTTHSANPSIYRQLPYDPQKDFTPIGSIAKIPFMLTVRSEFPANDFAAFLKAAREANPKLTYGSGNSGSRASAELLKARTGIDMLHVPFRGSPQAITDLIGGRIDAFFADPASVLGMVEEKRVKVLAVTGEKRVNSLPSVPTMSELGVSNYQIVSWAAVFAPAKLPKAIQDKLNAAIVESTAHSDMTTYLSRIGAEPFSTSPAELTTFVQEDAKRWVELVDVAQIERK